MRDGHFGTQWRIFAFEDVSMGDSPVAYFMEIMQRKTSERGYHIDEVAAKRLMISAQWEQIRNVQGSKVSST